MKYIFVVILGFVLVFYQIAFSTDITWTDKIAGSAVTVADYAEIKAAVNSKLDLNGDNGPPSAIDLTNGTNLPLTTGVTGTLPHENGGLEADVSAYSGLVGIAGGITIPISTKAGVEVLLTDVSDLAEADGETYSGTHDFSGATVGSAVNIISDSDGITLTGVQLYGGLVVESGNLQTVAIGEDAVAGMNFCVLADGADGSAEVWVDPYTGDHIEHDGTAADAGEAIKNSSDTKGDMMCFIAIDSSTWIVKYDGNVTIEEATP